MSPAAPEMIGKVVGTRRGYALAVAQSQRSALFLLSESFQSQGSNCVTAAGATPLREVRNEDLLVSSQTGGAEVET